MLMYFLMTDAITVLCRNLQVLIMDVSLLYYNFSLLVIRLDIISFTIQRSILECMRVNDNIWRKYCVPNMCTKHVSLFSFRSADVVILACPSAVLFLLHQNRLAFEVSCFSSKNIHSRHSLKSFIFVYAIDT